VVIEKGLERHGQDFIRAIANKDLVQSYSVVICQSRAGRQSSWIWIEFEPFDRKGLDRFDHTRGWRIGVFVGVELDEDAVAWLFTRDIGRQAVDLAAPKAASVAIRMAHRDHSFPAACLGD